MSAFNETKYKLRIQLVNNQGIVVDSFETRGMNWLRLQQHFKEIKASIGVKKKHDKTI